MLNKVVALLISSSILLLSVEPVSGQTSLRIKNPEKPTEWVGRMAADLFEVWGSPDQSVLLKDGGALLIYAKGRQIGEIDPRGYDSLSRKRFRILKSDLQFKTDFNNRIVEYHWLGVEPDRDRNSFFWGGFAMAIGVSIAFFLLMAVLAGTGVSRTVST